MIHIMKFLAITIPAPNITVPLKLKQYNCFHRSFCNYWQKTNSKFTF
ncbi:hypothetical protein FPC831_1750009 [Flavobacterium psychrophilum]|nr:hypothetical protein FI070_410081 [Flavobacterium psychrophilum]SNB01560.1 hypothetical protein FPC831_1750009 [Flavobacterium psychrophilum]SNB12496.1 hypothetical protein KU05112810_440014 [Flavobacterium psychrophilum]SNB17535.1 hypothetical protein IT2_80075 [Flavobacterium psychrophilum]